MKYKIALTFPWEPLTYWLTVGKKLLTLHEAKATLWNDDVIDEKFFQSVVKDFGQHACVKLIPVVA